MSRLTSLAAITIAALGLLPTSTRAQDKDTTPIDANSRVARCLKNLLEAQSYAFRCTSKGGNPTGGFAVLRQLGQQQQNAELPADVTEGVHNGTTLVWTRDDGETVLANRGRTWITKDRDGNWIPGRRPLGEWKGRYLPDPEFLASGLMHLMKDVKWEFVGPDQIGEKPVRLYKVKLDGAQANYLLRTRSLPQSGTFGGAVKQFVVIAAGAAARKANIPDPDAKIEIRIYEDPAKRMPLNITADLWIDSHGGIGGLFVQGGGGLQIGQQKAKNDEDDKKKKPTLTVSLDLSKVGKATTDVLDDDAKGMLGK